MKLTSAHAASLQLFVLTERVDSSTPSSAVVLLREGVKKFELSEDIDVVLLLHRGTSVSLEALTPFGEKVLEDLQTRTQFPPCPDGECEVGLHACCKWCGRSMLQ